MSIAEDSFLKPRYLSDASIQSTQVTTDAPYDLITFLGVIQKLQIEILPITWQAARQPIGAGATGIVNEALINLHTSFAFKCVSDRQKENEAENRIIRALISEVMVLSHPSIRKYSNIVELQGICWDIAFDSKVWPVLVFEKSQYGDLYAFVMLPVGRELRFMERLKLCIDVGIAISDMHFNNIMHGDIKPENVLVFKDNADVYTAKVTDFGYSTRFANEDDFISVPKSWPWCAPEHDYDNLKPAQARKMDVFSFGMLCLWILFERCLSGIAPLPQEAHWAEPYFQGKEKRHLSKIILEDLKQSDKLVLLAQQLVMAEKELSNNTKQALQQFFSSSLTYNPNQRESNFRQLFSSLLPHPTQLQQLKHEMIEIQLLDCEFEIVWSINSLYQSDYRVRRYIRHLLVDQERNIGTDSRMEYMEQNLAFQLALCYKIGFGGFRDETELVRILHKSRRTEQELDKTVDQIKLLRMDSLGSESTTYTALRTLGHIDLVDFAEQYRRSGVLEEAVAELRREKGDIEHYSGKENLIWVYNTHNLSLLSGAQGRWKEAEELAVQVIETTSRMLEEEHPDTLASIANLALMYTNQGRWEKAKELQLRVTEIRKRVLGEEHLDTLSSMTNIASTLCNQGQWKEAEKLFMEVIEIRRRVFGKEHLKTLTSMANLASTYTNQGRWKEAEELFLLVIETSFRALGEEHPATIGSIANLASTYVNQGRWKEATELLVQVAETRKRVLGEEHPETLTGINNLALAFKSQGQWKEAQELQVEGLQICLRVLGGEHPDTLTSMNNLALTFGEQGRWNEAKELQIKVTEIRKRVFGEEHPDTLSGIMNLASIFSGQGQWREAEELYVQTTEMNTRVLGKEHPNTLISLGNLASVHRDQGRLKEAEELQLEVMEMNKRVLGAEHPHTLISITNLASTYGEQGRWEEAKELQLQVMEKRKRVLGEEHPDTLSSIGSLASTYRNQGRWSDAKELYTQVSEGRSTVLGDDHPSSTVSMSHLAVTLGNQGRWKEAEELFVLVMETNIRVLGKEHPNTLISMDNLASAYRNQGQWEKAEVLQVKVMEMSKRVFGEEHPSLLTSMCNLAATFTNQEWWKESEKLELQVMETRKRILGEEHPDTLGSMGNLASTYRDLGQWKKAKELEMHVLETRKRVLGEDHPDTITGMNNLACTLKLQGCNDMAISLMEKCLQLQNQVLGPQHPYTEASLEMLNEWKEGGEHGDRALEVRSYFHLFAICRRLLLCLCSPFPLVFLLGLFLSCTYVYYSSS